MAKSFIYGGTGRRNSSTVEAISVTATGSEGVFQILAEHEAFVSELVPGEIHVKAADDRTYHFEIPRGGIAESRATRRLFSSRIASYL